MFQQSGTLSRRCTSQCCATPGLTALLGVRGAQGSTAAVSNLCGQEQRTRGGTHCDSVFVFGGFWCAKTTGRMMMYHRSGHGELLFVSAAQTSDKSLQDIRIYYA